MPNTNSEDQHLQEELFKWMKVGVFQNPDFMQSTLEFLEDLIENYVGFSEEEYNDLVDIHAKLTERRNRFLGSEGTQTNQEEKHD